MEGSPGLPHLGDQQERHHAQATTACLAASSCPHCPLAVWPHHPAANAPPTVTPPDLRPHSTFQVLTRDEPSLWPGMSPATRALVRGEMLGCLREEQLRSITKKVCDTVSAVVVGWKGGGEQQGAAHHHRPWLWHYRQTGVHVAAPLA